MLEEVTEFSPGSGTQSLSRIGLDLAGAPSLLKALSAPPPPPLVNQHLGNYRRTEYKNHS